MANFSRLVNDVIKQSDILLIVVDARRIAESINLELENKVRAMEKKFIYVINKWDLIGNQKIKFKLPNSIPVSARDHINTIKLVEKIMSIARGKEVIVGVIGYPNTGKSTLINALRGRHAALTSPVSGFTRAIQKVRINKKIVLMDTPGVIPYEDKINLKEKETDHILIGALDAAKVRDPELAAMKLIDKLDGIIEKYFGVEKCEDAEDTLSEIALKKNIIKKGKEPDLPRMGREIIALWQKGKIKAY